MFNINAYNSDRYVLAETIREDRSIFRVVIEDNQLFAESVHNGKTVIDYDLNMIINGDERDYDRAKSVCAYADLF